ncbi:hypothetical protein APA386B_1277 [Acetobacter pasteurianus 386B]|nr:hypothetical protein APA386B_1277 [Acetobacter pasteurianus 386B]
MLWIILAIKTFLYQTEHNKNQRLCLTHIFFP